MISMNKRTIERHVIGMIISLRLIIPKVRFKSFRMWPTGIPDAGECSRSSFFYFRRLASVLDLFQQ